MKKAKWDGQLSLFPEDDNLTNPSKVPTAPQKDTSTKTVPLAEVPEENYDHTALFLRLAQSDFRRSFHLHQADIDYIHKKGLAVIRQHAADFVAQRLAPAVIPNDGKQTPMRGHPVFLAQHATACCCRGCFSKWHHIPEGRTLTAKEQQYAVSVLMTWIIAELEAQHAL